MTSLCVWDNEFRGDGIGMDHALFANFEDS